MRIARLIAAAVALTVAVCATALATRGKAYLPGGRVLLDAHNAYPYEGRFADRISRALATGTPLAIEQDLAWCASAGGTFEAVVTHEAVCHGSEPTLRAYFFEAIRPAMERAVAAGPSDDWPLVTLNLDFKSDDPALHRAVWSLLGEYRRWLTTSPRVADLTMPAALTVGPLLVLTGEADAQQLTFHDQVPVPETLRLFGAVHSKPVVSGAAAEAIPQPEMATNYRRWWNHPWKVVEPDGQPKAGDWTPQDNARLVDIVRSAHHAGLWVRFYTLNGSSPADATEHGWFAGYNFGSMAAVEARWRAARAAGVDFIATDQYEDLKATVAAAEGSR
jgi:hypothetical protein